MADGALGHLRILDVTDIGGQMAGRVFADLGADVIKVEPPGGDPVRRMKPFAGDVEDPERSLLWLNYNLNKRGIVLDLENSVEDRRRFLELARTADAVFESFQPGHLDSLGLGYEALRAANPGIILTSMTSFGQSGPYRDYKGGDLIMQAMGGQMYVVGDDQKPPVLAPFEAGWQFNAMHGAFATLFALWHRRTSGRGQHIDVAGHEVHAHHIGTLNRYAETNELNRRTGSVTRSATTNLFETKDGYIWLMPNSPRHWASLVEWMDNPVLKEDVWKNPAFRNSNGDVADMFVTEFSRQFTKMEFTWEAQRRHIPAVFLATIEDAAKSEHFAYRKFFVRQEHPVVGEYTMPGPPYRWTETPWNQYRPAPLLGQHQEEVLGELESSVRPSRALGRTGGPTSTPLHHQTSTPARLPLEGIRILDFTRVWAGPLMTRYFADFGAEVIKVESDALDDRRTSATTLQGEFAFRNRNKKSITLNMQTPKAKELLAGLLTQCDVVTENFSPKVLDRWGFGWEQMQKINPRLVYAAMPGFGIEGPHASFLSYGQLLMAYSGMMYLWGHADSPVRSRPKIAYPDSTNAAMTAMAIMAALEHRERTGKGQFIEVAELENFVMTMGTPFLDFFINGRVAQPSANRNLNAAPHNVYPCRGDDAWVAIACYSDEDWRKLRDALEDQPWARDPAYETLAGRKAREEEIDVRLAQWTKTLTPRQVMRELQRAGVPSGMVASAEDMYTDIHLRARGFFVTQDHPAPFGRLEHSGVTVHLSETPGTYRTPMPTMGQHNVEVYGKLLGLSAEEVKRLEGDKVLW